MRGLICLLVMAGSGLASNAWAESAPSAAEELWTKHCVLCHGPQGKGDTKTGEMLGIKDLTDKDYVSSRTDEQLLNSILNGVKNEQGMFTMLPFGAVLKEDQVRVLIEHVRTLSQAEAGS